MKDASPPSSAAPVLLLTGQPGTGKTTALRQVVAALGERAGGFYTREVRAGSRRTGFELVTLAGERALLATRDREVPLARPRPFGRYRVDLEAIEEVGVPALLGALARGQVVVVDEIGPMEILSPRFQEAILTLLEGEAVVVGTIVLRPQPFADRVKAHPRVSVRTLTREKREDLPAQILAELGRHDLTHARPSKTIECESAFGEKKGFTVSAEMPWFHPALLQERAGGNVRCLTCERRCTLADGQTGWCRTRQNRKGTLYTLTYGLVSSLSANPIEKKPLYHFYPGTVALTVGAYSCNFACPWCQNWQISKAAPPARPDATRGTYCSPEEFVALARRRGCAGTSVSLNEPTLSLEWSLDVFRLASAAGMYNTYVSNGYMTGEALRLLAEAGLDAMNVDLKGDAEAVRRHCGGVDVEQVWRTCRLARELGVHLEVTTLVIPGVNHVEATLRGIACRIAADLGPEVPWHVTAYFPAYRHAAPPTPVEALEHAWQVGRDEGLSFVYVGNVPGHRGGDTQCPGCGTTLIRRRGLSVCENVLDRGGCPRCGRRLPGRYG